MITNKIVKTFLGTKGLTRVQGEKMSKDSKGNNEIMTVQELADYLHMAKSTVYSWTHKKKLRFYKLNNRIVFFKRKDVDDYLFNSCNLYDSIDKDDTETQDEPPE